MRYQLFAPTRTLPFEDIVALLHPHEHHTVLTHPLHIMVEATLDAHYQLITLKRRDSNAPLMRLGQVVSGSLTQGDLTVIALLNTSPPDLATPPTVQLQLLLTETPANIPPLVTPYDWAGDTFAEGFLTKRTDYDFAGELGNTLSALRSPKTFYGEACIDLNTRRVIAFTQKQYDGAPPVGSVVSHQDQRLTLVARVCCYRVYTDHLIYHDDA